MTPGELKAELAQLAAESKKIEEAVKLLNTAYYFMISAPDEVEAYGLGGVYTTKNPVRTDGSNWCERANALIDTPTPGLGAAMLRVVEAAKACVKNPMFAGMCDEDVELDDAVQTLNKLEANK